MLLYNHTNRGTYWRALGFARALVRRGHNVTILCTSPHARLRRAQGVVDGVRLVEFPDLLPGSLRSGWDLWNTLTRLAWLRGKNFDLVHAFETRPVVIFPALAVKRRGARLFLDWCDWFGKGGSVEERPNPLMRAILRPVETFFENHYRTRADGTTVINSFLRQRAISLGVKAEDIRLIRNGADTTIPVINCRSARQALGLPTEGPWIGFVGSTYTRDAQFMAAAFDHVLAAVPQARLILAGYFNRSIEAWVQNPSAIIRSGVVKYHDLYTYLAACDVCWLPLCDSGANRGRWPYKLTDYITVARPTISTAVGDLAEVIPQYGLGLVTPVDVERFAEETLSLLRDEVRAQAIGQTARRAAEEVFDWDKLTEELEAFYLGR
jgi:glycosyltransferase involved in cell wall biosynthesis